MSISAAQSIVGAISLEQYVMLGPFDIIVNRAGLAPHEHYEKGSQICGEDGAADMFVGLSLWNMAARNLEHAEDHLLLGRKTVAECVAAFLLEMDRRLTGTGTLPLPMCRRDIGDYLGLTLETVSRTLSQFHDQGILDFSGARRIVRRNRTLLVLATWRFAAATATGSSVRRA